jgi:shikimate dehydrogenase
MFSAFASSGIAASSELERPHTGMPIMAAMASLSLGLIGAGIGESKAPALHEDEARAQGIACTYRLIDLDVLGLAEKDLPELLQAAERMGFNGLNITHPCKQAVLPLLQDLSPEAAWLGAVNTVVLRAGRRIGHNTDWSGFRESFQRGLPDVALGHVVQFGAGGAGVAVAYALLTLGVAQLAIVDVDALRAHALAEKLVERFGGGRVSVAGDAEAVLAVADGVVNATPVGMAKYPGTPFSIAWLRRSHWVAEIVYVPLETPLLRAARALGCRTLDGRGMAVFQAAEAFRLFSGLTADDARMTRHFESLITQAQ